MTFPSYKSTNTLKLLIGITPSGWSNLLRVFLYSGSSSDKELISQSGLLPLPGTAHECPMLHTLGCKLFSYTVLHFYSMTTFHTAQTLKPIFFNTWDQLYYHAYSRQAYSRWKRMVSGGFIMCPLFHLLHAEECIQHKQLFGSLILQLQRLSDILYA